MLKKTYVEVSSDKGRGADKAKKRDSLAKAWSRVDKWSVVKKGVGLLASGCASVVISRYLSANMPECDSPVDKAVTWVGTYFLTGLVCSKVSKYAEMELDELRESVTIITEDDKAAEPKEYVELEAVAEGE